jgi:hypothetical protein
VLWFGVKCVFIRLLLRHGLRWETAMTKG